MKEAEKNRSETLYFSEADPGLQKQKKLPKAIFFVFGVRRQRSAFTVYHLKKKRHHRRGVKFCQVSVEIDINDFFVEIRKKSLIRKSTFPTYLHRIARKKNLRP